MSTKKRLLSLLLVLVLALACVLAVSCKKDKGDDPLDETPKTEWPEAGVYYFAAPADEYTLTLNVGDTFSLYIKSETLTGSYTLTGSTLVLDFADEGKENVTATYENNVIILTYEESTMRMLKKIDFTVTFNTNGGSAVASQTVVNGKTVAKPADPTRENYVFVGWYTDAEFTTPFEFGVLPITANTTVFARWVEAGNGNEYTATLDGNYDGAETLAPATTRGGQLFDLPTLERTGYTFGGWWFSLDNDGDKLTYKYEDGTVLTDDVTLYALWIQNAQGGKLTAPVVNVKAGVASWNVVSGARGYRVTIADADGAEVSRVELTVTTYTIELDNLPAGTYSLTVTALAANGEANNSQAVRYFSSKALDKVTGFEVIDGNTLVYNTVAGAEKYYITVYCGNPDHNHVNYDNGTSRTFSFANCELTADGISFRVTAVAQGMMSSVSDLFVYNPILGAVDGFTLDSATATLSWNAVPNAEAYMVLIECGNADHNHALENFGAQTSVSLKECLGTIVVKVYAKANGYNSPEASVYSYTKTTLATPGGILLNDTTLSWNAVANATGYEVKVNGATYTANGTTFDLAAVVGSASGASYEISVRAIGNDNSLWSDPLTATYNEMNSVLSYNGGKVTWTPVIGADCYEVQVNDGNVTLVENGDVSAKITLTQAGNNTVKVRFVNGNDRSEWAETTVFAHTLTFDSVGGSNIATQYLAKGDPIVLPQSVKPGYTFVNWYNLPGGPEANGRIFADEVYAADDSIVVYAYYKPIQIEVVYNYGIGGTGTEVSGFVPYENHYQLYVPTPADVAGAFGGWYDKPYGMGVKYTDELGNSLAPWTSLEGKTLYAYWIDDALSFTLTKVNGRDAYSVSQGPKVGLVTEVNIPATYKGLPVLLIPANAFADCGNLQTVNMPATVEQISSMTPFGNCVKLQNINVYDVDGVANPRYSSIDGVLFENDMNGDAAKLVQFPVGKTGSYTIPAGITEIPEQAFLGAKISKVTIPASVIRIGREAFQDCANLNQVTFEATPEGQTELPLTVAARAFKNCGSLDKFTIPARLTEIKLARYGLNNGVLSTTDVESAFLGCYNLETIDVAAANKVYKVVDGVIFSKDGKTLVLAPANLEGTYQVPVGTQTIGAGAFADCDNLTEVVIADTVTLVEECAFYGAGKLKTVTLGGTPLQDMTFARYSFAQCAALTDVVAGDNSRLAVIGECAFLECASLTKFTFPKTLTTVGEKAFQKSGLTEVEFAPGGKDLEFGADAFKECTSLTTVTLPANVTAIPGIFAGCSKLTEVNVDPESKYLTSIEGVVFDKAATSILFFPKGKTGTYTLPETLTTIPNGVFNGVSNNLTTLRIPTGLTYIGDYAFSYAKITNYEFYGDPVETKLVIGEYAFDHAEFDKITLPANTGTISKYAFYYALAKDTIVLSEGITEIGDFAFCYTRVTNSIVVPASVEKIGKGSFFGNFSTNTPLYFPKVTLTVEGSNLKVIGDGAFQYNPFITEVVIPASVEVIGGAAFYNCRNLTSLSFADGSKLTAIGAEAFAFTTNTSMLFDANAKPLYNCDIVIPNTVTTVGAKAFAGANIKSVTFKEGGTADLVIGAEQSYLQGWNDGVYAIGSVFEGCKYLESVVLPARVTELRARTFYNCGNSAANGLTVTFGDGEIRLALIGDYCFASSAIESFTVPATVRNLEAGANTVNETTYDRIGIGAFAFATGSLTELNFELGGTAPLTIGKGAFSGAALTELTLPARLDSYESFSGDVIFMLANGAKVFEGMEDLATISVEQSSNAKIIAEGNLLMSADKTVLYFCPAALAGEVTLPATVTRIYDYAFEGCSAITALTLPAGLADFDAAMIGRCSSLTAINVGTDGNGASYVSIDGVLYTADKSSIVAYPAAAQLTELVLPVGLKVIAPNTFAGNKVLVKVTLPAGVIEIGSNAFCDTAITEINIPSSVQLVGEYAFASSYNLATVTVDTEGTDPLIISDYAFKGAGVTSLTLPARLYTIGNYAFYGAGSLATVEFAPNTELETIGNYAFANSGIQAITVPGSVKSFGNLAFHNCDALVTVVIGEGVQTIGDYAFVGSDNLTSVSFPASLRTLGKSVFYYSYYSSGTTYTYTCAKLATVNFALGCLLEEIPESTFAYTGLESIEIPAGVKKMGDATFNETNPNKTVKVPGVFHNATKLQTVTFAEGSLCQNIGDAAFEGCTSLTSVTFVPSVATIGRYAFRGCTALQTIVIPDTVANLGVGTFKGCTALSNVTFNAKVTEIPESTFDGCGKLTSFTIPATVTSFGPNCFNGTKIASFKVADGNTAFAAIDGVLYNAAKTEIVLIPSAKKITTFTVPKTVTKLGDYLFANNTDLREVKFESGRTATLVIGNYTFDGCTNLVSIELPEGTTSIGKYAFRSCIRLPNFTVPSTMRSIDSTAFYIDWSVALGYWDGVIEVYNKSGLDVGGIFGTAWNIYSDDEGQSYLTITEDGFVIFDDYDIEWDYCYIELVRYIGTDTDVVIPEGVEIVTDYAFAGCDFIETITIPDWMEELEDDMGLAYEAFCGCEQAVIIFEFDPYTDYKWLDPVYASGNDYEY